MALLILGILLFWAGHWLKTLMPARRAALAGAMGEGPIKGGSALVLIGSVVLMTLGYQQAGFTAIWSPPGFLVHLNNLLMILAVWLFIAGGFKSAIADKIRHPQLAGVKVWALAHLLVNGDLASIILFGSMLAWAVVTMIAINKRDGKGPIPQQGTLVRTIAHTVITLVVFGVVTLAHNYFGVWPFPGDAP